MSMTAPFVSLFCNARFSRKQTSFFYFSAFSGDASAHVGRFCDGDSLTGCGQLSCYTTIVFCLLNFARAALLFVICLNSIAFLTNRTKIG
ncbi:hypothetical protein LJR098_004486 [Rhizobium sp. LjRoot98]|uniref:hypothetical protein n=1 Tax=Rhizobium sp. LjRoot98 TaxID=3342345 RepID=UPI003ECC7F30